MNKRFNILLCILSVTCQIALMEGIVGCKTSSPEDVAFKTTGTVAITATSAMSAWLDYKNTANPPVPDAQVETVKQAWNKYYAATQVEKDAVVAFKTSTSTNMLNLAITAASAASSDLIGLIMQFLPASNAAKLKGVK